MGKNIDAVVIGAGPAGLSAAIRLAELGVEAAVLDEKPAAGGQLFKQIHKFFGSEKHMAGLRGYEIGNILLRRCEELKIPIYLNTAVWGIYPDLTVAADKDGEKLVLRCRGIVAATGSAENPLAFPGWTLPGVMGAGAAQTMVNFYRVRPGKRAVVVGAGNVGLIVAYQLIQAGIEVLAVVEASPTVGGYTVHASKIRRLGVPIFVNHGIIETWGEDRVNGCAIGETDTERRTVPGTEKHFNVDMICIAVGLSPAIELLRALNIPMCYVPELGGHLPVHDRFLKTQFDGLYIAGDLSGIEEASSAMEEGKLAAVSLAEYLGNISAESAGKKKMELEENLAVLRRGPFGRNTALRKKEVYSMYGCRK